MKNLSSPHTKNLVWGSKLTVIISLLFFAPFVQAANPLDVVINEIAWMGTQVSYNDEWIELYNNTDTLINLDGWFIVHFTQKGEQGSAFDLSGIIPARGFYLLERTDDSSVPNITADKIYTGPLNNNGELLQLSDEQGTIIDLINCIDSGWFAGDNKTKQTMERISPDSLGLEPQNWQNSQNPGGTPKALNSIAGEIIKPQTPEEPLIQLEPETTQETQPESKIEPEKHPIYPSGIIINEILPSPEGPDAEEEWIEVFNQNNFEVDLFKWEITDIIGKITTYTFPEGTKISSNGFLVLSRPNTKITLNNDGDELNLIQPNGNIIDKVIYEKAPKGKSYNRTESGWVWSDTLTSGLPNKIPTPEIEREEAEKRGEEVVEKEIESSKELAAISEQFPKEKMPFSLFLVAFLIAIFSGITILVLKKTIIHPPPSQPKAGPLVEKFRKMG